MICFVSLQLALLVAAAGRGDSVPAPFAARVRSEVAARWSVDSAAVQLEWSNFLRPEIIDGETPFRIAGSGSDGWLVVVIAPPHAAQRAIRVRAGVVRMMPVAAHALHAGQRLAPHDVEQRKEVVWSAAAASLATTRTGWEVRHDTPAGTILSDDVVIAPRVIAAGDHVVFIWEGGGVHIEREAVAVSPARLGEVVLGQIGTTRISGRATGHGTAQMKDPKETIP